MKKMMVFAAVIAAVAPGFKKKRPEEGTGGPAAGVTQTGSAGSAAPAPAPAPAAVSGDDLAKTFDKCWGYFNDSKWDDFKACYSSDAVEEEPGSSAPAANGPEPIVAGVKDIKAAFPDLKGEPLLEIVDNHDVIAISLVTGTQTGPLKTPAGELPASKNKTGHLLAQVIEFDAAGKVKHQWGFSDTATTLGHVKPDPKHPVRPVIDKLPAPKQVVISKDDAAEKANEETAKKVAEAFSKHDAKAFGDLLADNAVWSQVANAKDQDKKQIVADAQDLWKSFSNAKLTVDSAWSGGDYVVTSGAFDATNDGDLPKMGLKKTGKTVSVPYLTVFKIVNGKVESAWQFDQSLDFAQQLGLIPAPAAPAAPAGSAAPTPPAAPAAPTK